MAWWQQLYWDVLPQTLLLETDCGLSLSVGEWGLPLGEPTERKKSPKHMAAPRKVAARTGAVAKQHQSGLHLLEVLRLVFPMLQASPHGSGTMRPCKAAGSNSSECAWGRSLPGRGLLVGAGERLSMRAVLAILPLLGLIDRQLGFEPRRELINSATRF